MGLSLPTAEASILAGGAASGAGDFAESSAIMPGDQPYCSVRNTVCGFALTLLQSVPLWCSHRAVTVMIGCEPRGNDISRPVDGVLLQRCAGRQAAVSWHGMSMCVEGEEGVGTAVEKNEVRALEKHKSLMSRNSTEHRYTGYDY